MLSFSVLGRTKKTLKSSVPPRPSSDLHEVVQAYEHAVLGIFPRGRYVVGSDAKYNDWPLTLLPEWMSDIYLTRRALVPKWVKTSR